MPQAEIIIKLRQQHITMLRAAYCGCISRLLILWAYLTSLQYPDCTFLLVQGSNHRPHSVKEYSVAVIELLLFHTSHHPLPYLRERSEKPPICTSPKALRHAAHQNAPLTAANSAAVRAPLLQLTELQRRRGAARHPARASGPGSPPGRPPGPAAAAAAAAAASSSPPALLSVLSWLAMENMNGPPTRTCNEGATPAARFCCGDVSGSRSAWSSPCEGACARARACVRGSF